MLDRIDRLAGWLSRLAAIAGTLGMVALTLVICADVVGRVFGSPIYGAQDITSMALVVVIFGGMSICDRIGGHIVVDVFENAFPAWVNRAGDIISAFLGAMIFGLIAYEVWDSANVSRLLNLATNVIELPKAWFQYYVVVAAIITALGMALRGVVLVLGGTPPHEKDNESVAV